VVEEPEESNIVHGIAPFKNKITESFSRQLNVDPELVESLLDLVRSAVADESAGVIFRRPIFQS